MSDSDTFSIIVPILPPLLVLFQIGVSENDLSDADVFSVLLRTLVGFFHASDYLVIQMPSCAICGLLRFPLILTDT